MLVARMRGYLLQTVHGKGIRIHGRSQPTSQKSSCLANQNAVHRKHPAGPAQPSRDQIALKQKRVVESRPADFHPVVPGAVGRAEFCRPGLTAPGRPSFPPPRIRLFSLSCLPPLVLQAVSLRLVDNSSLTHLTGFGPSETAI